MRKSLPGWSNPSKFLSQSDEEYNQFEMMGDEKFQGNFMTRDNSENKQNDELPSRHGFKRNLFLKSFCLQFQI